MRSIRVGRGPRGARVRPLHRVPPLLTLGVCALLVAAESARSPTHGSDRKAPDMVRDLTAGLRSPHSVVLSWTAPGDDGDSGVSTEYDLRMARDPISASDWNGATPVSGEPKPGPPGAIESFEVTGLEAGSTYHFALRTRDETPEGWSQPSRSIRAVLPPDSGVMVLMPPGEFRMGSPRSEPERHAREHRHEVRLTRAFWLSDHEVTQDEWREVMADNPSELKGDGRRPVEQVDWFDALDYCNRRSLKELLRPAYVVTDSTVSWDLEADGYRLPTEAEWEYACRAGSVTAFSGGHLTQPACAPVDPVLSRVGWYCGNSREASRAPRLDETGAQPPSEFTRPARQKLANTWGLFDMHGNVSEWCWDWLGNYPDSATDPIGPPAGAYRVVRGGCRTYPARYCRAASRSGALPTGRTSLIGLRVARNAGPGEP